jgi:putative transposase
VPLSLEDAERLIAQYVKVYNEQRLHSALGYVMPTAMLQGRRAEIHAGRDRKLEEARRQRERAARLQRVQTKMISVSNSEAVQPIMILSGETEAGSPKELLHGNELKPEFFSLRI